MCRLHTLGLPLLSAGEHCSWNAQSVFSFAERAVQGYTGTLRIGFGVATIPELIPQAVIAFRKLHPELQIEMRDMSTPSQVQALLTGVIDVGFIRLPRSEIRD